jgi:hypothetical protein
MWAKIRNAITYIGFYMLWNVISGKGAKTEDPTVGRVTAPVAQLGMPIPVIFGTCDIKAQNVVWYGDIGVTAVKAKSGKKG